MVPFFNMPQSSLEYFAFTLAAMIKPFASFFQLSRMRFSRFSSARLKGETSVNIKLNHNLNQLEINSFIITLKSCIFMHSLGPLLLVCVPCVHDGVPELLADHEAVEHGVAPAAVVVPAHHGGGAVDPQLLGNAIQA